jgi:putative ABC transport system permease protein
VRVQSLWVLVRRDLGRTRGALVTSGFGIAAGTAALIFFLALGLGVRSFLLGDVFPVDQVELEPPKGEDPGVVMGLLFGAGDVRGVSEADVERLREVPGVEGVFPKLRFAFPSMAKGGKELFGREIGTHEMIADGIEPSLVTEELGEGVFYDPIAAATETCESDEGCKGEQYCELPSGAKEGKCSDPIPALVSPYLIEIFDKSIAPAHKLPPMGASLVDKAKGITFNLRLGESLLGKGKRGAPRSVRAKLVGISKRAIDLGMTVPIDVVRRWNEEYAGEGAGSSYSSVVVQVGSSGDTARVIDEGQKMQLSPKDTRARDVSVLITSVFALLTLVAAVILVVSASNIAYTFRVLVTERKSEIALYRAVGATAADMRVWMLGLAVMVGLASGAIGVVLARLAGLGTDALAATQLPDFPFKPETFFAFPPWLWAAGLAFAALFSALGAWGPSGRAARVEPAAALAGN